MINYEEFLERYYPSANAFRQNDVERFLDNFEQVVGSTPLTDALTNKQTVCQMFFLQKNGCGVSRPHYQKIKEYLINIFDMCNVDGTIPSREEVVASQQNIGYFRSITDLLKFIDDIGNMKMENYNPTTDLVIVKSICVLGWLGFSPAEIADMKKGELQLIGYDKYKIRHGEEEFIISGEPFAALYYLSDLESYKGLPSGKKQVLRGNPSYLFRPVIHSEKMVADSIIQIIKRFNANIPSSSAHKAILFRNLRKNALFLEIYFSVTNKCADKTNKSLLTTIMEVMKCDRPYALSYREQYLRFVRALENNII